MKVMSAHAMKMCEIKAFARMEKEMREGQIELDALYYEEVENFRINPKYQDPDDPFYELYWEEVDDPKSDKDAEKTNGPNG